MNCPNCGHVIPSKSKSKGDAKFREDVRRAESAIRILENCGYPELYEACQEERLRLLLAIQNPPALWAIYRRKDKAAGYAVVPSIPEMELEVVAL